MLIVEGPDNVGKSTLIKQLIELDPSLRVLKRERFKPNRGGSIGLSYLQALCPSDGDYATHANSIADRFFASECIYGQLYRGGCRMTVAEHSLIKHALLALGTLVVFCDPGDDAILGNWPDREQLYSDPLGLSKAYRLELPSVFANFRVAKYNWVTATDDDRRRLVDRHRLLMNERQRHLAWWGMAGRFGLGRAGRYMFVGEASSPQATTPIPFAQGPAGEYLFRALERVESSLNASIIANSYFTNASKFKFATSDYQFLREEIAYFAPMRIISLGNRARTALVDLNVQSYTVPHPGYWDRFHHDQLDLYAQALTDALTSSNLPRL
jgi:hypothetical protein